MPRTLCYRTYGRPYEVLCCYLMWKLILGRQLSGVITIGLYLGMLLGWCGVGLMHCVEGWTSWLACPRLRTRVS